MRRLMPFPVRAYVVNVFGSALWVCAVASVIPFYVYRAVSENIYTVLLVCALCVLSCMVSIYYIGLDKQERGFVINMVKKKILHRR